MVEGAIWFWRGIEVRTGGVFHMSLRFFCDGSDWSMLVLSVSFGAIYFFTKFPVDFSMAVQSASIIGPLLSLALLLAW
jgi:hypothetical protein